MHDYHRELYAHLEQYEIGPSLYAAPWFLTAFASHFPLGFVARVFGRVNMHTNTNAGTLTKDTLFEPCRLKMLKSSLLKLGMSNN